MFKLKISLLVLALCLVFSGTFAQDNMGARPVGMGRTFVAIADDGNAAFWNPGGMDLFNERVVTGMFSRLYWGVDNDAIGEGNFAYIHHFRRNGSVGFSSRYLFSNLWNHFNIGLAYSKKLSKSFSLGAGARVLINSVNKNNIDYEFQPGDLAFGIIDPLNDDLFSDEGWSTSGFTFDFGAIYKPTRNLSLGLNSSNLLEPDMSLATIGTKGHPMTFRVGAAYWYKDFLLPTVDLRYLNAKINEGNQFKPHVGIEWWFLNKMAAARTGYTTEEYSFGFSYRSKRALDLQIDYAFVYPLSDVRKTGAISHKISASVRFLPPPELLDDLSLKSSDMDVYPKNAIINEPVNVTAKIENLGEKDVKAYQVSLYYEDPERGWTLIGVKDKENIGVEDKQDVSWTWTPPTKGYYKLFAATDDNGTKIPEIDGALNEIDEENNKGFVDFEVFALPEGEVQPKVTTLDISRIKLIREEEPLVPTVFFEPGGDAVDGRYDDMLNTIAARLKENPDIEVNLKGYYNTESEVGGSQLFGDRLAARRAQRVQKYLISKVPSAAGRIRIIPVEDYNTSTYRTHPPTDEYLPEYTSMVEHENRRVELETNIKGVDAWDREIYFDRNSASVDKIESLKPLKDQYEKLLRKNPEAFVLIEGNIADGEQGAEMLALDRAQNVREALGDIFGDKFFTNYKERIFISASDDLAAQGKVRIGVSGESLIFRPKSGTKAAKGVEIEQDQTNFVKVSAKVPAGVAKYRISVVDKEGNVFKVLGEGTGEIPQGLPWDWKNDQGNLVDPEEKYLVRLDITDKLGQDFTTYSDTLDVQVTERLQHVETLVIVQFTYDQEKSKSKFLESRIQFIAEKFLEKAREPKEQLRAVIGGHTDVIGFDYRNKELSEKRARKEEQRLRKYLIYLLSLNNNNELNAWLKAHNTTLVSEGFVDNKPYIITKWEDGQLKEKEIGNNDLPEGRTINRRVVIEFYMDKTGAGEEKITP